MGRKGGWGYSGSGTYNAARNTRIRRDLTERGLVERSGQVIQAALSAAHDDGREYRAVLTAIVAANPSMPIVEAETRAREIVASKRETTK